jgi:hypothetical protein
MSRFLNRLLPWGLLLPAFLLTNVSRGADTVIRAEDMSIGRGQTNRLYITLESLGNENALGFTLCFDTNYLTFLSAVRGSAVTNIAIENANNGLNPPSLSINSSRAASQGLVGIILGLDIFNDPPQTWNAGSNSIIEIRFRTTPGSSSAITSVAFCTNSPVAQEVSNPDGNALPSTFVDATVTIQGTCAYSLATNAVAFGSTGGAGSVNIITDSGCPWASLNTNSWITITSATNGSGAATVNYTVAANPSTVPRSGTLVLAGRNYTVTQQGITCTYSLSANAALFVAAGGSDSVDLSTDSACAWTVQNTNAWIAITSATSGSGNATVNYLVAANPTPALRSGTFIIAGQNFTATQQGIVCTYSLSTNASAFVAAGGSNSVSLSTDSACVWTTENTNSWITITSLASGTGNATVNYSVAANPTPALRSGTFIIAGQNFTVTQQGMVCTYSLNTNAASFLAAGGQNSVNLSTDSACAWTVQNTNAWIAITSATSGSGNATVNYSVAANPATAVRSGVITIAGQSFTITQQGIICTYSLSTNAASFAAAGGSNSVNLSTDAACAWTVENTNAWITIASATSGFGSASVNYSVAANPSSVSRSGTLFVAGQSYIITQLGIVCSYSFGTNSAAFDSGGGVGSVALSAVSDCSWSVSNTNSWIAITSAANGAGSTNVQYSVAINSSPSARTGIITIAGMDYAVSQQGIACTYLLSPTSRTHISAAATNSISVSASNLCPWSVVNTNPWISILSGSSGVGNGTVVYAMADNPSSLDRTGTLVIGGQVFSITQQGACTYSLTPTKRTHGFGATASSFTVNTGAACPWAVVNTNSWITLATNNGVGSGTVGYAIDQNPAGERVGIITVDGQSLIITQLATQCSFTLSLSNRVVGSNATTGILTVVLDGDHHCPWTAVTTNGWIIITSNPSGTNNGTVSYSVLANTNSEPRTGAVFVDGQVFTLTQLTVGEGFTFESISMDPSNQVTLKIVGSPLGVWELQFSLDLSTWTKIANVTNTTGHVDCLIPGSGATNAFYRMKLP